MSAVFLHSPPDQLGYIGNPEFQVVMITYLRQPCPLMAPFVGRYFGKRATALDRYGANLSAASLPGQGCRVLHNTLQSLLQAMMKVGGIHSEKEAVNLPIGKIGDPHVTRHRPRQSFLWPSQR